MTCHLAVVTVIVMITLAGCVRREGRNNTCEWPQETLSPLDVRNPAHRRHLVNDAQFAEELGIRYGDSYQGKETVDERGRRVVECTDRLLNWITVVHSVTQDDVQRARAARDWRVDAVTVYSPMAIAFGTVAFAVVRRVRRRFSRSERVPALVATLLASLVIALAGVLAGELWSWLVEIVRVGDGHLSYRAFRIPWTRHRLTIFVIGVLFFWIVAWFGRKTSDAPVAD